jgi:signal transduction histidine kinase
MPHFLTALFNSANFTPHGFCLLWDPGLLWLHGVSDTVIGLSYFSIPLALLHFARRRRDLEYRWILWLFAIFILACGTTHFLAVATLWVPLYWLDGAVKLVTAVTSVATASLLWPLLPRLLELPSPSALRLANEQLSFQMQERERHIAALQEQDARMRHLQRMEALGKLSAGIAHDFNNVLQAVSGGLRMIKRRADQPEAVRELADVTAAAVGRGAAVAGRLLAIGRKAPLRAEPLAPGALLGGLSDILAPAMGPAIDVRIEIDPATPALLADRAQLETVLLNLAVNARDAMPSGGTLTLTAQKQTIAAASATPTGLAAGDYVRIALIDTGHGMAADILARAGEPFFTTKPAGEGTGLGVAMARAFTEQSGGAFGIASAPGRGTTVTLWFAAAAPGLVSEADTAATAPGLVPPHGRGHILMVDDDTMVRDALVAEMKYFGYEVTSLPNAKAALEYLDTHAPPDLIITDYAMPGVNGLQLIESIAARCPNLPVVLLTGFAEPAVLARLEQIANPRIVLLRKPVPGDVLADRVSQMLVAA